MTVTNLLSHILAVTGQTPAVRRIMALGILVEATRLQLVSSAQTAQLWTELGDMLSRCAVELRLDGDERDAWFGWYARQCFALSSAVKAEIYGHRPGGGLPCAERAPRTWRPSRVIDVAVAS